MMEQMVEESHEEVLELAKLRYDKNSQDVKLIVGTPVIARVNKKALDIFNNETFVITNIDFEKQSITVNDDARDVVVTFNEFQKLFYVSYCISCHRSQGQTYDHPYTIHEWHKMDERLKYVSLSRATQIEHINIIRNKIYNIIYNEQRYFQKHCLNSENQQLSGRNKAYRTSATSTTRSYKDRNKKLPKNAYHISVDNTNTKSRISWSCS